MDSRHVTVNAVGHAERLPDAVTVELRAIGDGEAPDTARAAARERSGALRGLLQELPTDRVRTVNIEVESAEAMFQPVTDAPYQATEQLHVDCAPETAEAVVIEATSAGASVQNVQFKLTPETRDALTDEALSAAMERAREKAERLAAAEGLSVSGVQDVRTVDTSAGFQSIVDEALDWGEETNLHPAPVTVSEGVEVVYELTAP